MRSLSITPAAVIGLTGMFVFALTVEERYASEALPCRLNLAPGAG